MMLCCHSFKFFQGISSGNFTDFRSAMTLADWSWVIFPLKTSECLCQEITILISFLKVGYIKIVFILMRGGVKIFFQKAGIN